MQTPGESDASIHTTLHFLCVPALRSPLSAGSTCCGGGDVKGIEYFELGLRVDVEIIVGLIFI